MADDLDAVHADWSAREVAIVQSPRTLNFGRSVVALDPDGHRLRVVRPIGPSPNFTLRRAR